jgi:hypothetical protein
MQRKKCKIIITSLLMIFFLFGITGTEVKGQISNIIELTGIMNDNTGTPVIHSKYVTREELAQMLIQASPYAGEVKNTNELQLFKDVPKNSSKAAYIQIAVTKGYMSGYTNGKFKPKKAAKLKEVIYGTLVILGYTKDDFAGKLSGARYDTFKELGLSKNLSCTENDKLTQKDCQILFYNLLNTKQKMGDYYCKALGYSLNEDNVVDYNSVLKLKSKGPIITQKGWENQLTSKLASYTILLGNKKISTSKIKNSSVIYYAEQAKKIWVFNQKVIGTLDSINYSQSQPQEFVISGITYTVEKPENMKSILRDVGIQKGMMVVLLLGRDDKVSYVLPVKSTMSVGDWTKQIPFDVKNARVYKNDSTVSVSDIKNNDVIYYSTELKTIWDYDKKIYGILEGISVNAGEPQELTIAGTNYIVENSKTMKKMIKDSSIQSDMPVVLLLGWDDKVTKVIKLRGMLAEENWQQQLTFDVKEGTIYKNGTKVNYTDIASMDAIYYSNELKTLWIYDKKVYGVIESISPTASAPDSIVVAGKTYELKLKPINSSEDESADAGNLVENAWGNRLRKNEINEGDSVVLLFGYNGKVVNICPIKRIPVTFVGYVLSVQNKVVKNEYQDGILKQVIRMVDTEGTIREFPCSDNTIGKGSIVEITFQSGKPVIKEANIGNRSDIPKDITTTTIVSGARLMEVKEQNYTKISVTQLKESNYSVNNILYYKLNSVGEITDLIVSNATDSFYQYGILKKVIFPGEEDINYSIQYTFDLGDTETTITMDNLKWNINVGPKAVQIEDGKIKDMQEMREISISYISQKQANTGDAVYRIADDAVIFFYKNGEYYLGKLDDIKNFSDYRINGYIKQQGPIRVIVVNH